MHLHIHRYPQPLLMIAKRHGFRFEALENSKGEWHILFTKNQNLDLKAILQELGDV